MYVDIHIYIYTHTHVVNMAQKHLGKCLGLGLWISSHCFPLVQAALSKQPRKIREFLACSGMVLVFRYGSKYLDLQHLPRTRITTSNMKGISYGPPVWALSLFIGLGTMSPHFEGGL